MGHKARKARHVKLSWNDFIFCWMAEWCSIFNYRHHWKTYCKSLTVSQIMPKHNNVGINKNVFIISFGGSAGVLGMRFADNMSWIAFRWQHHLHLLRRGVNVTWITFKVNVVINMLIIFRWFKSALCFWTANTKEQTKKKQRGDCGSFCQRIKGYTPPSPLIFHILCLWTWAKKVYRQTCFHVNKIWSQHIAKSVYKHDVNVTDYSYHLTRYAAFCTTMPNGLPHYKRPACPNQSPIIKCA